MHKSFYFTSLIALITFHGASFATPPSGRHFAPTVHQGEIARTAYDGVSNDLLTAGLGASGLASPTPPAIADAANPTAEELRRLAIYNNYRGLVPTDAGGGYGVFFGPTVDNPAGDAEGKIAGTEYLAYARQRRDRRAPVTMMVQVPDHFDPAAACIVTAPSSGSRGVYGAIGTSGEWGLKKGCAVAYTDKGSGTGFHNLSTNTVTDINGVSVNADTAGRQAAFRVRLRERTRLRYAAAFPDRYAFKHAHSQRNPERDWGRNVLQSIEFAFYVLNRQFEQAINPANTIVIASSVSNGGGASMRSAEQDRRGLIDGVAVSEPNVNPKRTRAFGIQQGDGPVLFDHSRNLFDYVTLLNLYQGCASAAAANAGAPLNLAASPNACTSLAEKGLLSGADTEAQAAEAQRIINDYGIVPEQNPVQPSHWFLNVAQAVSVKYANAYGRVSVIRNLCGYSYAASDAATGAPTALATEPTLFGTSNGIPPTAGVNLINNNSVGGAKENRASTSQSTNRDDQNIDGALCLRSLAIGRDVVTGKRLTRYERFIARQIRRGIRQVLASGRLKGTPAVIVTGRNDALLPINHTSRGYYGLNQLREGSRSQLRYYEITNAQHLDALNPLPGFAENYVPLHHYLFRALDIMYAHLRDGEPLPPSQVVRTVPRGEGAPALSTANLTEIDPAPADDVTITFNGRILQIPE